MRILYTLNSGQPGGMEWHVLDLVNGMVAQGHEVFVWCNEGPIAEEYKKAGAEVYVRKIKFDIDPTYITALYTFIKDEEIDIVHSHELKAVANSLLAGVLARVKVNVSHTHTPISEWQIASFMKSMTVFGYSKLVNFAASAEIALTDSRKRTKMKEGIKESKLVVIPNSLDLERFDVSDEDKQVFRREMASKYDFDSNKFIFGVSSRLTVEKGHEGLVRAFAEMVKFKDISKDHVHLLLAGGGELEEDIAHLAEELGISENITVTGRYPEEDKIKLFSSFDAFVFPSFAEGFGIVLIEAMAMRLPIICSHLEVLEEVAGSTVFSYFEVGDTKSLAQKMHELYVKQGKLDELTQSARERVEQLYSPEKFNQAYLDLYTNLLEKK